MNSRFQSDRVRSGTLGPTLRYISYAVDSSVNLRCRVAKELLTGVTVQHTCSSLRPPSRQPWLKSMNLSRMIAVRWNDFDCLRQADKSKSYAVDS